MKMEARGFLDLARSTTEEVLIKSMMDNPIGNMAPSMEMLGFKKLMQPFRASNEELFNSCLINGEVPDSAIAHCTQQASMRNSAEEGMQHNNIQLGKAWFRSSQPLTRSRPLELRRRYAAMQAPHNIPEHDADRFKQDFTNMRNFCNVPMGEMPNHLQTFMLPSNSSTAFCTAPIATTNTVSSLVSMLKGTLEHKKLDDKVDNGTFEGGYNGMLTSEVAARCISSIQGTGDRANFFHLLSPVSVPASVATIEKSLELNMDGFPTEVNQTQMGTASQEPSQSDSSTAAPAFSADFEVCDVPLQSGNTATNCGNSRKHLGNGSSEHEFKFREFRERLFENSFKDSRKKESLARMDSISSGASVEKADPTKKRRVERSRKMAEAKERNSTSSLPSDMQAILKRCENLEKEVRSLKLNLSFMNRKDIEQAKQIEDLEKQNEELTEKKERLLEEREQIVSEYGKF